MTSRSNARDADNLDRHEKIDKKHILILMSLLYINIKVIAVCETGEN